MSLFSKTILTTYGDQGQIWLTQLPDLIRKLEKEWSLSQVKPLPQMRYNFVAEAVYNNQNVILKIGPRKKDRLKEALAIQSFPQNTCAPVIKIHEDTGSLLIEKINSSHTLENLLLNHTLSESDGLTLFSNLILKMKTPLSPLYTSLPVKFQPIDTWGLGFEKFLREQKRGLNVSTKLIESAHDHFFQIVQITKYPHLLHGDLHQSNILVKSPHQNAMTTSTNAVAIDPKGLIGDFSFEVAAFIRNPYTLLQKDQNLHFTLKKRIEILTQNLELNEHQLWQASFSMCVLAMIWSVNDEQNEWIKWELIAQSF